MLPPRVGTVPWGQGPSSCQRSRGRPIPVGVRAAAPACLHPSPPVTSRASPPSPLSLRTADFGDIPGGFAMELEQGLHGMNCFPPNLHVDALTPRTPECH